MREGWYSKTFFYCVYLTVLSLFGFIVSKCPLRFFSVFGPSCIYHTLQRLPGLYLARYYHLKFYVTLKTNNSCLFTKICHHVGKLKSILNLTCKLNGDAVPGMKGSQTWMTVFRRHFVVFYLGFSISEHT